MKNCPDSIAGVAVAFSSERYVAVDLMTSVCSLAECVKNALSCLFWSDDPVNQAGIQGE